MEAILLSLSEYGSWVIFFGLMVMFIPTELVLAFGGFLVVKGYTDFEQALFAAIMGGVLSQIVLFYIARIGGRRAIVRFGKYIFMNTDRIGMLEEYFKNYGSIVLILGRFVPGPRSLASVAAGLANMHIGIFTFYTFIGLAPVSYLILFLGEKLGQNWAQLVEIIQPFIPIAVIGVVVLTVVFVQLKKYRMKRKQERTHTFEKPSSNYPM